MLKLIHYLSRYTYRSKHSVTATTLLLFSQLLILHTGIVSANDIIKNSQADSLRGGPNEIDSVYFSVSHHTAQSDYQDMVLNFWPRHCASCSLSGVITPYTLLIDSEGNSIPIASLRKNRKYEAIAIIYAEGSGGLIERILLSEAL